MRHRQDRWRTQTCTARKVRLKAVLSRIGSENSPEDPEHSSSSSIIMGQTPGHHRGTHIHKSCFRQSRQLLFDTHILRISCVFLHLEYVLC